MGRKSGGGGGCGGCGGGGERVVVRGVVGVLSPNHHLCECKKVDDWGKGSGLGALLSEGDNPHLKFLYVSHQSNLIFN